MGLTKTTTNTVVVAIPGYTFVPQITESYSFSYDANNRLSQVLYSNNNPPDVTNNIANRTMTYTYSSDTIYKTITTVHVPTLLEKDTFIVNAADR